MAQVVPAHTAAYWMERVAASAYTLSMLEQAYRNGRVPKEQVEDAREVYRTAVRLYTDPFGVKEKQGERTGERTPST